MFLVAVNQNNRTETIVVELDERPVRIGRKPERLTGEEIDLLRLPWNDRVVNRNHSVAKRQGRNLVIERLPALTGRSKPNAFYTNAPLNQRTQLEDPLTVEIGQSFTVGARGETSFFWLEKLTDLDAAFADYDDILENEKGSYEDSAAAAALNYEDDVSLLDEYSLRLQLKLIQRDLPNQVLKGWTTDTELFLRAATFLENALPGQKGVSAVFVAIDQDIYSDTVNYDVLNPDPNLRADFRPSRTLLSQLAIDHPTSRDIHVWTSDNDSQTFTAQSLGRQIDWVAAVPVASMDEDATVYHDDENRPVYLYVETRHGSASSAAAFVPFLRLIAALVASLLSAREKQRAQDRIAAYFSPGLRKVMQEADQSTLEPSMVDCTVLFADRRGHSQILERAKTDEQILEELADNQQVIGEITGEIFDHEGVVTDFAGDGVLALWGWPVRSDSGDANHALEAVEAAESVIENLADRVAYEEGHRRDMAAVRFGISTGRLAVGKTGPKQQWHLSVFGSVANLGARLEMIAKEFRVPLLISGETYLRIAEHSPNRIFRKLCFIKPAGFQQSYPIYEVVLPKLMGGSGATKEMVEFYEKALSCFVESDWDGCERYLTELPDDDPCAQWLAQKTTRYRMNPPGPEWEGDIASLTK